MASHLGLHCLSVESIWSRKGYCFIGTRENFFKDQSFDFFLEIHPKLLGYLDPVEFEITEVFIHDLPFMLHDHDSKVGRKW